MSADDTGPWWTISERVILELLRKVHNGEHPDDVYAELYANADHRGRHREGEPVNEYSGLDAERFLDGDP